MTTMIEKATDLRRDVGVGGVIMFGAGTAIGVSIFSVLQPAAQIAGSGLLLAMVVAALPMGLFSISYAYLASTYPVSGASYEWPRRFLHPGVGFTIVWLRILSNIGALTLLSQVLANYLSKVVTLPAKPLMALALTTVFGLNLVGVGVAARAQAVLMGFLLAVLAVFVATGAPHATTAVIGDPLASGHGAILACIPLMISLFLGIEAAVEIGDEVRNPRRAIPLGIVGAIGLTVVVYGSVAAVALGLVGPAALAASKAPLLDAARTTLGPIAVPLIVTAATVSILKAMNANALIFSRSLFAMGRTKVLPDIFARIHPRFGTPYTAVLLAYALAMTGLLLPSSLIFLLLTVNVPTMLKYAACSLSAERVAAAHPDLRAKGLQFAPGVVRCVGLLGAATALGIMIAGMSADTRPYELIAGWLGAGAIYWWVRARTAFGKALND
ncbi:APC family permease [Novosphingobium terrae]|uniref:APC family permease n=1 Tax=Novosphingobium terrae TaxID=2726189 RepID=UPI00197CEA00|nr:amino acid permease [Novosphingobium terrae]